MTLACGVCRARDRILALADGDVEIVAARRQDERAPQRGPIPRDHQTGAKCAASNGYGPDLLLIRTIEEPQPVRRRSRGVVGKERNIHAGRPDALVAFRADRAIAAQCHADVEGHGRERVLRHVLDRDRVRDVGASVRCLEEMRQPAQMRRARDRVAAHRAVHGRDERADFSLFRLTESLALRMRHRDREGHECRSDEASHGRRGRPEGRPLKDYSAYVRVIPRPRTRTGS